MSTPTNTRFLALLDEHHLAVDGAARAVLLDQSGLQGDNLAGSVARTGPAVGVPGLGVELLPHQHPAVRYAVSVVWELTRAGLARIDEAG